MLAIGRGPRDFRYGSLGDGQPELPVGEAVRAHHLRKAGHSCARRQYIITLRGPEIRV